MKRTHTCGELREEHLDENVVLQGWVHKHRIHGGLMFINIRDRYGITQVVLNEKENKDLFKQSAKLTKESVIEVHGQVAARKEGMKNPSMPTGDVEVEAKELTVLSAAEVLPMDVDEETTSTEDTRLKYRYLDLRRHSMQQRLLFRHRAAQAVRNFLSSQGFVEIETPFLVRSTPEGARDYIVPSRVNAGKFYALPQSPQLYKQMLMVAGFDRYFQLPRCLRDEDLRADRQPEHTQIDIEMSFPNRADLFEIGEGVCKHIFRECLGEELKTPFPILTHKEAMDKYGIDKPDLRIKLFLHDVTEICKESTFEVFTKNIKEGGIVKGLCAPAEFTRKQIDKLTTFCQENGAKGLVWLKVGDKGLEGGASKFLNEDVQKKLIKEFKAKKNSTIFLIADSFKTTNEVLAKLRLSIGYEQKMYDPTEFAFCWVNDFPLYKWDEEEEKWDAEHHLFCMPVEEDMKFIEKDPGKVRASSFDLVLNGVELASGSIRIHRQDIQEKVMNVIGITKKEAEKKFGFLLNAFKYGAPPHGGWAIGFDRLVALMQGLNDIREVIAFPKNKNAQCPMDDSPNEVAKEQLKELHIKTDLPKK